MAGTTTNLGLVLPVGVENVSRSVINSNNEIIDAAIGAIPSGKTLQGQIDEIGTNKADKVTGGTANNFAGLDASGNLKDSGKNAGDFVASDDFYATEMPMSSSDSTNVFEALSDKLNKTVVAAPYSSRQMSGNNYWYEGEVCIYGDKFYRCNGQTSAFTWSDSKWDEITIKDEIQHAVDMICDGSTKYTPVSYAFFMPSKWYHETGRPYLCMLKSSTSQVFNATNGEYHLPMETDTYWYVYSIIDLLLDHHEEIASQKEEIETLQGDIEAVQIHKEISTSVPIMSFFDGADGIPMKAEFEIAPAQNLNGYEYPWPGGGGKNKLSIESVSLDKDTKRTESDDIATIPAGTYIFSWEKETTYSTSVTFRTSDGTELVTVNVHSETNNYKEVTFSDDVAKIYSFISSNAPSGTTAEITKMMVRVSTDSDATFAPYANLCPITGWTGAEIKQFGANIYTTEGSVDGKFIAEDGTISTNTSFLYTNLIPVDAGKKIYVESTNPQITARYTRVHGYNSSGTWVQQINATQIQGNSSASYSFVIPSGITYIRISIAKTLTNVSFNMGDEYSISFPAGAGTVYGGTLTVNKDGTGQLVVKWARALVSDLEWTYDNTYTRFNAVVAGIKRATTVRTLLVMSECFESIADGREIQNVPNMAIYCGSNSSSVFVKDTDESDSTTFIQKYGTTAIVYQLATPVTYTLTAEQAGQILSLLGTNNLFCDTGDVLSVDYSADTKLYVDEHNEAEDTAITSIKGMIADSDAPVATANHAVGDVFICDNQLVRATSAIASGETVNTGTGGNAEVINLASYIKEQATAIAGVQTNVDNLEEKAIALSMTPLNRAIFPNYRKNISTGHNAANLRYTDVLYNTIRSEGHPSLNGTTYRGIYITPQSGIVVPGERIDQTVAMYKSYFRKIEKPVSSSSATFKMVVHYSTRFDAGGDTTNVPMLYMFTYDSQGSIKKVGTTAYTPNADGKSFFDYYFILPDDFLDNGNIAIGINYRTPKQTIERKIEFFIVNSMLLPEGMTVATLSDTGSTVLDDPT